MYPIKILIFKRQDSESILDFLASGIQIYYVQNRVWADFEKNSYITSALLYYSQLID